MIDIVSGWYSIERRAVTTIKCQWRRTTAQNTGTVRDGVLCSLFDTVMGNWMTSGL